MAYKHHKYFAPFGPCYMQHACFSCRKSFKLRHSPTHARNRPPVCPDCGCGLHEVGRQFKAPRRSDTRQWRKVKALVTDGVTFHTQGHAHLHPMPTQLREVAPFVARVRRRDMSAGALLLADTPKRRPNSPFRKRLVVPPN